MATIEACLARADEADAKIARLHDTVQEITTLMATTKPAAASGGGQQLQAFQKDMLQKLRALRDSLDAERAPFAKMQVERDQAVAGQAKLAESNEKMAYRIKHLLRAIDPEFAASQEANATAASAADSAVRKGACLVGAKWI